MTYWHYSRRFSPPKIRTTYCVIKTSYRSKLRQPTTHCPFWWWKWKRLPSRSTNHQRSSLTQENRTNQRKSIFSKDKNHNCISTWLRYCYRRFSWLMNNRSITNSERIQSPWLRGCCSWYRSQCWRSRSSHRASSNLWRWSSDSSSLSRYYRSLAQSINSWPVHMVSN